MKRSSILMLAAACVLACPGAALAKHGKVGLWNVTSTAQMALPPGMAAKMKKSGASMPASPPVTVQMCMSREEVNSGRPPQLDSAASGCDTHLVSQSEAALKATMVCKGTMKGKGSIEIAYRGAEHYAGFYNFSGTLGSNPVRVVTRFTGVWVKTDCGKVKPYRSRTR